MVGSHSHATVPVDQQAFGATTEAHIVERLAREVRIRDASQPVVAIDIDGVVADFNAAVKPYSLVAGTGETCPSKYNFVDAGWFNSFDDFEAAHGGVMAGASTIPLADETASVAVQCLIDAGFRVIAVTARKEKYRGETEKFFVDNNINITPDRIFFVGDNNKSDIHFDYIVDDAPKNIVDVTVNTTAMPVVYSQRYNTHIPCVRVSTLLEFAVIVIEHWRHYTSIIGSMV